MIHLSEYINEFLVNGHTAAPTMNFIDLDLPSGTLWATCNLGAEIPSDTGYYFMFADTVPISKNHECSGWETYPRLDGKSVNHTPYSYINDKIYDKNGVRLLKEYDAVSVMNDDKSYMPTVEQSRELYENTDVECVKAYGGVYHPGFIFRSKKDPSKEIFIPMNGYYTNGEIVRELKEFNLWTSTKGHEQDCAFAFSADSAARLTQEYVYYLGFGIRGVMDKQ